MKLLNADLSQYSFRPIECRHLRDFYRKLGKRSASYSIKVSERLRMDFDILYRDSSAALIVFSGAKKNSKVTVPFFSGKKLTSSLDVTVIFISDPSLYLDQDLLLAWYSGAEDFLAQEYISGVLLAIKEILNIGEFVFFGGSGGGFAGLFFSNFFPNSLAIVFNPQTNIVNYPAGDFNVVNKFADVCFSCDRFGLVDVVETDLRRVYSKSFNNKIIYMQNITDSHSCRDLKPFCESFGFVYKNEFYSGLVNDCFYLHLTDWSPGHNPPPYVALKFILHEIFDGGFRFSEAGLRLLFERAESIALQDNVS